MGNAPICGLFLSFSLSYTGSKPPSFRRHRTHSILFYPFIASTYTFKCTGGVGVGSGDNSKQRGIKHACEGVGPPSFRKHLPYFLCCILLCRESPLVVWLRCEVGSNLGIIWCVDKLDRSLDAMRFAQHSAGTGRTRVEKEKVEI